MKKQYKKVGCLITAFWMMAMMMVPSYAATESRKKISTVKITVESNIIPGTDIGDEDIEIKLPSNAKYEYESYEVLNAGTTWDEKDIPQIVITLHASEGYYFDMKKASSVSLKGATYLTAKKENSKETLTVAVKLPSLEESIGEMTEVTLTDGGYAYWEDVPGAGSYEIRVYRNGSAMGVTEMLSTATMSNVQEKMKRSGEYWLKVRARNKINEEKKSDWVESNIIVLNADQAADIREGRAPELPKKGEWKQTDGKWMYLYEDGSYPVNEWKDLDSKWYLFDEQGFIRTGWVEWEGKEYYLDENTGAMLTNTVTPDGYHLDGNGNKAKR